jgi:hypothetical protein
VPNSKDDATLDLDLIQKWWWLHPFAMIGSPVAINEVCLDVDPRHDGDIWALVDLAGIECMPATRTVLSGRYDGGHHLFFQRPEGVLKEARLPKGIDLRDGGKHYTILPPSVHPDTGGPYFWRGDENRPAAELPDQVHELLKPQLKVINGHHNGQNKNGKPTSKALAGILRTVANMPEGNRQKIGWWVANRLKENGHPDFAWDALEEAMRYNGASEHDISTALRERPGRGRVPS